MRADEEAAVQAARAGEPVLAARGIYKRFGAVEALKGVDVEFRRGEIHAIVGENGAGKSTLTALLGGVLAPDAGFVAVGEQEIAFTSPLAALEAGIGIVYQELSLLPEMTVADNVTLGIQPRRGWLIDRASQRKMVESLLERVGGTSISTEAVVGDLPIARQQLVEIAKVLARDPSMIVFDEPTAMLPADDSARLLEVIRLLAQTGVAVGYISHRLDEVMAIADTVTVLRDGALIWTRPRHTISIDETVRAMVGRSVEEAFPERTKTPGHSPVLEIRGVLLPGTEPEGLSFTCHRGEILGVAGLVGSGRSRLARWLMGLEGDHGGDVHLDGASFRPRSPRHAIRNGLMYVPEDRKRLGLLLQFGIDFNVGLPSLDRLSRFGMVDHRKETALAEQSVRRLGIRTTSVTVPTGNLSGGNQQKTVLAKWLAKGPKVLLLDEPLRGIDVNAKFEIHKILRDLADEGFAILLISSELPELLEISDRLLVMRDGKIAATFEHDEFAADAVMAVATLEER